MKIFLCLIGSLYTVGLLGQSFLPADRLAGYALEDSSVTLIFDPQIYGVQPRQVVVTGAFRDWGQNMEERAWQLQQVGDLWLLHFDNSDYRVLSPGTEFKYRIDEGAWMAPPTNAPNEKGGNLVFMQDVKLPELRAEILGSQAIWANIEGERPLLPEAYRLTNAQGQDIPIAEILPNTESGTLIIPGEILDPTRVYFLEIPAQKLKAFCSFDGWFRTLYSDKALGANVQDGKTTIRVFAPRATGLKVYLYKGKDDTKAYQVDVMKKDAQGVWEIEYASDLHGVYYDFTVHGPKDPGNHFYQTQPVHISDPYARVSDNTWGKSRIWRATQPASPLKNGVPAMEDVIAYEVHVQDFTDQLPVAPAKKGTLAAMIEPGLTNSRGEKIGFDYLIDLGVNVVHLMPVQEYLHFPDGDWQASFAQDEYMISQGISEENYQWGYRTTHAFAVESKYRTKGEEPGAERESFRDLVQAFHDHDMAVIIDIVPNHTGENMDGNDFYFHFNALDKQYYYRTKDFEHIGAYGNEVKTENRPMVQRWLIDQCLHYIEEFGVDGFRIDLAGQIDRQTLIKLKEAIGHDKILYGEAWIGSNDPDFENNPSWDWYKHNSPITFFQDDARNAYKGPVFELLDKEKDRGWPGGKFDERQNVMKGLANKFPDDQTPLSGISYLDIHDNFTLADQFATHDFDGRLAVDQDLYKIAVTLLYTTLGPIVTHGGSEIMRSKGAAPLREVEKKTKAGFRVVMHGKRDTYNHRLANNFLWEQVGAVPEGKNRNDYQNMLAFWKGMNTFRQSEYGQVFRVAEPVEDGYYEFFTPQEEHILGYVVDEKVFVLLNAGRNLFSMPDLKLPGKGWLLIANNREVNLEGVEDLPHLKKLPGGQKVNLEIEPQSLKIWVRKD